MVEIHMQKTMFYLLTSGKVTRNQGRAAAYTMVKVDGTTSTVKVL